MPHHAILPNWNDKNARQKLETLQALVMDLYGYQLRGAREALLTILAQAQPADDKEARDIEQMQQLIGIHPNIMAQNCEIGHITGSALIIDGTCPADEGRILLHQHKTLGRWLQMGGHADYETDFADVAWREACEESGLHDLVHYPDDENPSPVDFDIHTIPVRKGRPEHLHLDWRYILVTQTPDGIAPPEDESQQWQWLTFANALHSDQIEPSLKRLISKAQALWQTQAP